jgi:hypothetical protein
MKILNKIWGISLLALLLIVAAPRKSMAQNEYISEQDFYDELQPYGTWVSDPQYGDVWVPDVQEDFRPYGTQGHWVLTRYGNTWVSDYPWGWATFHYGRWRYDNYYGWEWIPGYEWAPAWVSWRHGGGYYGWAPLMPGISISLSFGSDYRVPNNYWAFAPEAYINRPNVYNYYVPHSRVVNIINNTTIVNNTYVYGGRSYIAGPGATDIQRYTHQRPQVYAVNNASRPGAIGVQNNTVNIFRPAVRRMPDAKPERVVDANAYKQQNPNQGIAHRGPGGAAGFNPDNAAKLATVARNTNDNNNVVRVNHRPDNNAGQVQPGNRADQRGNQPYTSQPANQGQPASTPTSNPAGRRGRPEDRPNIAPPNQQNGNDAQVQQRAQREQQRQQQAQQQNQPIQQNQAQQVQRQQQQAQQQQQTQQVQQVQRQQQQQTQQSQRDQQRTRREQQSQQQAQQQQQSQRDQQRTQRDQQSQQQAQQQQQSQRDQQRAQRDQQSQQQAQQQQQSQRDQQRAQQSQQQAQQQQQTQQSQRQQQAQQQQAQQAQQQPQRQQQQQAQQAQQQAQRQQQQQAQQQRAQQQQKQVQPPPPQPQKQRRPPEEVKP